MGSIRWFFYDVFVVGVFGEEGGGGIVFLGVGVEGGGEGFG